MASLSVSNPMLSMPRMACTIATPRYANVDRLRLLALLGIVYFHVSGEHFSVGLGLPIFLLFTVALNARPPRDPDALRFVKRKFKAFLLPWLSWSAFYGAIFALDSVRHGEGMFHWFEPGMLLVGTQWHLWYLVFGLGASLLAFFARRGLEGVDGRLVITVTSLAGCAVMIPEHMLAGASDHAASWLLAIPAIPIGIAISRCLWENDAAARVRNTLLTVAIVVGGMVLLEATGSGFSADRYLAAMIPVGIVLLWRGAPDRFSTWLTKLRLGVYLIHPLMIRLCTSALPGHTHPVLATAAVIGGSIVGVWLLSKSPLRWMVDMGEGGKAPKAPNGRNGDSGGAIVHQPVAAKVQVRTEFRPSA